MPRMCVEAMYRAPPNFGLGKNGLDVAECFLFFVFTKFAQFPAGMASYVFFGSPVRLDLEHDAQRLKD